MELTFAVHTGCPGVYHLIPGLVDLYGLAGPRRNRGQSVEHFERGLVAGLGLVIGVDSGSSNISIECVSVNADVEVGGPVVGSVYHTCHVRPLHHLDFKLVAKQS